MTDLSTQIGDEIGRRIVRARNRCEKGGEYFHCFFCVDGLENGRILRCPYALGETENER